MRGAGVLRVTGRPRDTIDRMAPQDLFKKLNAKPFMPFRVFLSDGKTYDVGLGTYAMMAPTELIIGIELDESGFPLKAAYISPNHVVRVEPLPMAD